MSGFADGVRVNGSGAVTLGKGVTLTANTNGLHVSDTGAA